MTSRYIADYLRELRNGGKTVILSAHNLFQVEAICDRILILRRGQVVADGTMPELRDRFGSIRYRIFFTLSDTGLPESLESAIVEGGFFRIDAPDIAEMNQITRKIVDNNGVVERIESHYPSLEEMLVRIGT
jgi:ABC-2 type transport system ATP-binding protein